MVRSLAILVASVTSTTLLQKGCAQTCLTDNFWDSQRNTTGECDAFVESGMYSCDSDFLTPGDFAGYCNLACEFNAYDSTHGAGQCDYLLSVGYGCESAPDHNDMSSTGNFRGLCDFECGFCRTRADEEAEGFVNDDMSCDLDAIQRMTSPDCDPDVELCCDTTVLFEAAEMERTCCGEADETCDNGPPSECTRGCASLFLPLYQACRLPCPNLIQFNSTCTETATTPDTSSAQCEFEAFLASVALTCAQNSEIDPGAFCSSACYEAMFVWNEQCGQMSAVYQ
eukprot:SAG31_NODE_5311_length_2615_cov_20.215917_2_plen_282_part_01